MSKDDLSAVFAEYSIHDKWDSLATSMRIIQDMETAYSLRRRMNPHHTIEQKRAEAAYHRGLVWEKWCQVKDLYAEYRDELANTLDRAKFKECKDILERIFTNELDDAIQETLE